MKCDRIEYLDTAKAIFILILCIMFGHVLIEVNPGYSILQYTIMLRFLIAFHVPGFYIITGILFQKEKWRSRSIKDFLKQKIRTIIVPYIVFEIIGTLVNMALYGTSYVNILGGIYNLISVNCNVGSDWFLPAYFIANVIYFMYIKHSKKLIALAITILSFVLAMIIPDNHWLIVCCRGFIGFAFIFIGSELKLFFRNMRPLYGVFAFTITVIITLINGYNDMWSCTFHNPFFYVVGAISGTYFVMSLSKGIHSKLLTYMGKRTLTIMGTHQLMLNTVKQICEIGSSYIWIVILFSLLIMFELVVLRLCDYLRRIVSLKHFNIDN